MTPKTTEAFKNCKILFWNARSIRNRKTELPTLLNSIDIFICVESWLTDNDIDKDYIFDKRFVQLKKKGQKAMVLEKFKYSFEKI